MDRAATASPRRAAYQSWRERLADKQAAAKAIEAPEAKTVVDTWDPARLFASTGEDGAEVGAADATPDESAAVAAAEALRIELELEPAPAPEAEAADEVEPDRWSQSRYRTLLGRRDWSAPPRPAPTRPKRPSLADGLQELNTARREGRITDDEFNARKAALFAATRPAAAPRPLRRADLEIEAARRPV